jgi:16S rRNA (adenine1518-N6/adenine1519-N6)-dimethyltransferase
LPALEEVVGDRANVRIVAVDASDPAWSGSLDRDGWILVANLPYNVSVPIVLDALERVPAIDRIVAMVQREVADRLVAEPGTEPYGPVTVRVAWRASVGSVRRVPADVFWPRPSVESTVVRVDRIAPPTDVDLAAAARVVEVAFAERRKTIANALRRLGLGADEATTVALEAGIDPAERPERVTPAGFTRLTVALLAEGWTA